MDFPKIYKFVFTFLKGEEARNIKIEHASQMWSLLLKRYFGEEIEPFLEKWTKYLEKKQEEGTNGIKKDEWNSLLEFLRDKGIQLSKMKADEMDCWPILIDEFLEYLGQE